jgi:hypothetical protein
MNDRCRKERINMIGDIAVIIICLLSFRLSWRLLGAPHVKL